MKKAYIFFLVIIISLGGYSQRFKVQTFATQNQYKKHYSHSIEGGFVNTQARQFVAGNMTDWGTFSDHITGRAINGSTFLTGRVFNPYDLSANIQLTDFTIYPTDDYRYGAGTGVYYPNGVTEMGYPFLGIYDKETMEVISAVYYDISYPGIIEPDYANAIGLRVKYSREERAFYISGVMANELFADINMNNIRGKSKGFIMKIDEAGLATTQVLIIEPDIITDPDPTLCVVTDLEISANETEIAFTGMTSKSSGFTGYYHPMAGIIDMDLNVSWCNVYEFPNNRYSGVDVEYNTVDDKLLVLLNSQRYPFALMELNLNGTVNQNPVDYVFDELSYTSESARAHIMHYNNGEILITGNCFVTDISQIPNVNNQLLFTYEILDASALLAGSTSFNYYDTEEVPLGSQKAVTGYWAPENSIYQDGNLSMVGIYNDNNTNFGYTLIQFSGWENQEDCEGEGSVDITGLNTALADQAISNDVCTYTTIEIENDPWFPGHEQDCPTLKSAATGLGETIINNSNLWQFKGIDAQGIHATLLSENDAVYQISVYDVMGRKIHSSSYNIVDGQKEIYLEFTTNNEMYIISVSNGVLTETLKVISNR